MEENSKDLRKLAAEKKLQSENAATDQMKDMYRDLARTYEGLAEQQDKIEELRRGLPPILQKPGVQ